MPKSARGIRTHKPPKSPRQKHNLMIELNKQPVKVKPKLEYKNVRDALK